MSPNNGKNIIDLNAVRAHKKDNRELDFMPLTSSQNSRQTVNRSTTRRPTPRRSTSTSNQKRNVRNSYSHSNRKYQASLKKNYIKVGKLVAAGALAATIALGGFTGYQFSNHNNGNVEYSLDEYDPTELFYATDELVEEVAEDILLDGQPDMKETLRDYYLESYNESSVTPFFNSVTLKLNYIHKDPTKAKHIPKEVTLPKDFAEYVYLPYKDLRETSQKATDKEKEKTSYWLKINKNVTDLTNGLETYIETTQDKQYVNSAKTVLDDSKLIDDDEGR